MRAPLHMAVLAALAAACAAPVAATASEQHERERLQAAHDATLQLELRGRLGTEALARGVREVKAWWTPASPAVDGSVDEHGVLRVQLPAIAARATLSTPIVHLVDRGGAHWYCAPDLAAAPPTGVFDLGGLRLLREPDPLRVVDDRDRALPGAHVLLRQDDLADLETVTDAHGIALLCRAAPFGDRLLLAVRHEEFAPWWGEPTARVQLDHGSEIRGRVALPPAVDASDFAVHVWVAEAALRHCGGDAVYANVTAPIARDGSYRLRNVPPGRRSVGVQDRLSLNPRGSEVEVQVGPGPATAESITLDDTHPEVAMRIRLLGEDDRPVAGSRATVLVSDVGIAATLHNGILDWVEQPDEPFAIAVPGYARSAWSTHHTGETIRLRGGHRVTLRLDLDSARRLPPGCALRASVCYLGEDDPGFGADPIHYEADPGHRYDTPQMVAHDAGVLVASTGRYAADLELVRWVADQSGFDSFPIDVAPREFVVRAGTPRTVVTLHTEFVAEPR